MVQAPSKVIKAVGGRGVNIGCFGRHIRAENLSEQTFIAYVEATRRFTNI